MRIEKKEGEYFPGKVRLKQERVILPWLFNAFEDYLVREVNARVSERGVTIRVNRERFERNHHLDVNDAMLKADSEELLQLLVGMLGIGEK